MIEMARPEKLRGDIMNSNEWLERLKTTTKEERQNCVSREEFLAAMKYRARITYPDTFLAIYWDKYKNYPKYNAWIKSKRRYSWA